MSAPGGGAAGARSSAAVGAAWVVGGAALALADLVAIAVMRPARPIGAGLVAAHVAFDAAESLGLGLVVGAIAFGLHRAAARLPSPRDARASFAIAYVALATLAVHATIGEDLHRQAALSAGPRAEPALFAAMLLGVGLAVPTAHLVASALVARSRRLAPLPVAVAALALVVDHALFPDDFFGIHGVIAACAAVFSGAALAPTLVDAAERLRDRRAARGATLVALAIALAGLVVPPPNAVRFELFAQPLAVAPWVLAWAAWRAPQPAASAPAPAGPWFEDRSAAPPIPPTEPPLVAGAPVVVLVTVDATRFDVVDDPRNEARLPTFAALRRRGAYFRRAIAPASQTALTLSTIFSGKYFSELRWAMHGEGETRFVYPAVDDSPRVPELLTAAGVDTAIWKGLAFLRGDFGVARGFREDPIRIDDARHALAETLVTPLVTRLGRVGPGRFFGFSHLLEPHAPYDRGGTTGTVAERYLAEIALADRAIGRVLRALERSAPGRFLLIVTADHGEAFGDHGTTDHGKTLYEELLHVPLFVIGVGVAPRVVEEPVDLVDLAPTLLDVLRVPAPAWLEGQSLVPLLAGGDAPLDRPRFAEGRLRRAIVTRDGVKVIDDLRRKTVEAYDLVADPGETKNLFGVDPRGDAALRALRTFFAVHTYSRDGYAPPYKN